MARLLIELNVIVAAGKGNDIGRGWLFPGFKKCRARAGGLRFDWSCRRIKRDTPKSRGLI